MIAVAEPSLGPRERAAVMRVMRSGWLTSGPVVRDFERAFAARHGAEDAVAVSSCTAALHLALAAMGIGPGDEVVVPSLTFVASVNAVLYTGAEPVLADIEALDAPLLSLRAAEAALTRRTRAIVLVHYAGHLPDPAPWRALAARRGVALVEDAAHAVGMPELGRYGEAACFSFYGNKNLTTAEGGMVLMRDARLLERARQMRGHGMTSGAHERLIARSAHYDVTELGFNYRMDEMRAAIGLVQLGRLESFQAARARLVARYADRLGALAARHPGLVVPQPRSGRSAHHILPVLLPPDRDRAAVAARLTHEGVQTTVHYPPVHELSYHRRRLPGLRLPLTEEFHRRTLTLPLHPALRGADVDRVAEALDTALADPASRLRGAA